MPLRNGSSSYTTGMLSKVNGDSTEKCRRRRRRRIRMRRLQAKVLSANSSSSFSPMTLLYNTSEALGQGRGVGVSLVDMADPSSASTEPSLAASHTPASRPVVGVISIIGRRRAMEDKFSIRPNLCSPEINRRRPVHFFAIYDGHGGRHVAALCSERMHVLLQEELTRVGESTDMSGSSSSHGSGTQQQRTEEAWKRVLRNCFLRIDEIASTTCGECGTVGHQCDCPRGTLGLTGSTAVVAVLTEETIIVANCGDSRAVLSRDGQPIPLSSDHKPDRRDERARIEASGGQVVFANGARVQGILAMSRAIGDKYLSPYVISEPEITFTKREAEDVCLILASDGLWDVISNDMACEVASECLREEDPAEHHSFSPLVESDSGGAVYSSRSASAAALLTQLAIGRNSSDNISVIVVDLKRSHTGG